MTEICPACGDILDHDHAVREECPRCGWGDLNSDFYRDEEDDDPPNDFDDYDDQDPNDSRNL